jgi:hypothetical protein
VVLWRRRDARRRLSNVVSDGIRRLTCFSCGVFSSRCDDRRRYARCRFSSFVSNGIPRLIYSKYGVFWRRRDGWHPDARRRVSSSIFNDIPRLACAKYGVFGGVAMLGVGFSTLCPVAPWGWRLLATSRLKAPHRQATRRLASIFHVLFDGIPTFICGEYAVLCRSRFSSIVFSNISRLTCAKYGGGVTIGVVTPGVGLLASVVWRPKPSDGFICSLYSTSRRSESVFQRCF